MRSGGEPRSEPWLVRSLLGGPDFIQLRSHDDIRGRDLGARFHQSKPRLMPRVLVVVVMPRVREAWSTVTLWIGVHQNDVLRQAGHRLAGIELIDARSELAQILLTRPPLKATLALPTCVEPRR